MSQVLWYEINNILSYSSCQILNFDDIFLDSNPKQNWMLNCLCHLNFIDMRLVFVLFRNYNISTFWIWFKLQDNIILCGWYLLNRKTNIFAACTDSSPSIIWNIPESWRVLSSSKLTMLVTLKLFCCYAITFISFWPDLFLSHRYSLSSLTFALWTSITWLLENWRKIDETTFSSNNHLSIPLA